MTRIPLRCRTCGNATLVQPEPEEGGLREVNTNICPLCDEGDFESLHYVDKTGRELSYGQLMEAIENGGA